MRPEGSGGDDSADDHDDTAGNQQRSATDALAEHEGEDRAEETTQLITGGDRTAEDRDMLRVGVTGALGDGQGREFLGELVSGDDTGHQALVITEEGKAHDGGEGDRKPKLATPQARGGSPHGDLSVCWCLGVRKG